MFFVKHFVAIIEYFIFLLSNWDVEDISSCNIEACYINLEILNVRSLPPLLFTDFDLALRDNKLTFQSSYFTFGFCNASKWNEEGFQL